MSGCKLHDDCFTCPFEDCIDGVKEKKPDGESKRTDYHKEYYKKNREKILAMQKAYKDQHREEINSKRRAYYRDRKSVCGML